jgi:hypothetical protein
MSESEFYSYLREMSHNSPQFDCSRTQRALEREGVRAPVLDGELLQRSLESMLHRDPDLQPHRLHLARPWITQTISSLSAAK